MTGQENIEEKISVAVVYLARGFGEDFIEKFTRFRLSYENHRSGTAHRLYVIFKGFVDEARLAEAEAVFSGLLYTRIDTDDLHFDIGAYTDALPFIEEDYLCFLNTNSEIQSEFWLAKLIANLKADGVGLVGATGSYESLNFVDPSFPRFPNPHLRTNAFALRRETALDVFPKHKIVDKFHAWAFESGYDSLTQKVLSKGLACLVVGKDSRGYSHQFWPESETYRQGSQANLLVHDNVTRLFMQINASDRAIQIKRTWGFD